MKVKLGDIFEIGSGGTPSKAHPEYYGGEIPWVKTGDLKSKYLYEAEDFITNDGLKNSSAKMYEPDTVLIAMYGATIGATSILKMFACTNQACAAFRKNDKVIPEFLYYFLKSRKERFIKDGVGGAQPNISAGYLKKVEIELPPLEEQQVIVNILDKASSIILGKKYEIQLLDELVKARFVEMFGDPVINEKEWVTKPLLDMGICKNGMNFHYNDCGVEINCLGVGDFKNLSVIDNTEQLSTVSLNEMPSEEYLLKDDDIVFVRSNGNKALVGRSVAVYPGDIPTTFSGFCIRYRKQDDAVTIPYLLRVLKTDSIRRKMAGRGANIQNLNQQILGNLIIPVPPIELQNQFSDFVRAIDKSKVNYYYKNRKDGFPPLLFIYSVTTIINLSDY